MAYVISVCGAGGKTTYIYEEALKLLKLNKKVAVITTTRMRNDKEITDLLLLDNKDKIDFSKVNTFGIIKDNHLTYVGDDIYRKICDVFDVVFIEADGSRCMPMKIPNVDFEPVIKDNTNEIVITYSPFAYGRKIEDVCFRYEEVMGAHEVRPYTVGAAFCRPMEAGCFPYIIVNKEIIEDLYDKFYVSYIKQKFPNNNIKINIKEIDIYAHNNIKNYNNISLVLLCAGLSKRFKGENKLFIDINGKPLYEYMLSKLVEVKKSLSDELKNDKNINKSINVNISVVVNNENKDIIINNISSNTNYNDIKFIINKNPLDGLSSSVKLAVNENIDKDAICFFNCDMPLLKIDDIVHMIKNTMLSDMNNGAMYNDGFKNPAMFYKKYYNEILNIEGDKGPRELLDKYEEDTYRYHIDSESLIDIDTEDMYNIIKGKI